MKFSLNEIIAKAEKRANKAFRVLRVSRKVIIDDNLRLSLKMSKPITLNDHLKQLSSKRFK